MDFYRFVTPYEVRLPTGLSCRRVVLIVLSLPFCICSFYLAIAFVPILAQEIRGQLGLHLYPNTHYIYDLQIGYGSGSRGDRNMCYWTEETLEDVQLYYGNYFPLQELDNEFGLHGYTKPVDIWLVPATSENISSLIEGRGIYVRCMREEQVSRFFASHPIRGSMIIYQYPLAHWD
jgi:hypothetical protein